MTALEAASVPAFERLARELATRFGVATRSQTIKVRPVRSLEAIAKEDAVEGCVRETFGALTAHFQAPHATDPHVRRAMKVVAHDETRHAALARRVANWLENKLDPMANARVAQARARATKRLVAPQLVA